MLYGGCTRTGGDGELSCVIGFLSVSLIAFFFYPFCLFVVEMRHEQLRVDDVGDGQVVGLMGYVWFVR